MARVGKIARLPFLVRLQLNSRLRDGELGESVIEWLNALPVVKQIMAEQFKGLPVNSQNLSDWRLGGYQDWLRIRESCEVVEELKEESEQVVEAQGVAPTTEHFAEVMTVEFVRVARERVRSAPDEEVRWERLTDLMAQLNRMRRADHQARRVELAEARWEWEEDELENQLWERNQKLRQGLRMKPVMEELRGAMKVAQEAQAAEAEKKKVIQEERRARMKARREAEKEAPSSKLKAQNGKGGNGEADISEGGANEGRMDEEEFQRRLRERIEGRDVEAPRSNGEEQAPESSDESRGSRAYDGANGSDGDEGVSKVDQGYSSYSGGGDTVDEHEATRTGTDGG